MTKTTEFMNKFKDINAEQSFKASMAEATNDKKLEADMMNYMKENRSEIIQKIRALNSI